AVYQVLSTGQQSLQLSSLGTAVGGTFNIGARMSQHIANLVIPQGVTAIDLSSTLKLSGTLTNSGSIYTVSLNPNRTNATISAANIVNLQGGLITSTLPAAGLSGFNGLSSKLSLTLNAMQDILNSGVISSAGNLSLTAGGQIVNALPTAASALNATQPVIQAL